ncbi:hypothetical protein [Vibrio caribbeanicus]
MFYLLDLLFHVIGLG